MAGIYFTKLLTRLTPAAKDQEHIEFMLFSRPQTPDRTAFILGEGGEDPFPFLLDSANTLVRAGAEVLAITCMTSHYFYPQLVRQVSVPILHGIRETAALLKEKGIKSAGILATSGAVRSGIYQETFQEYGLESVLPDAQAQRLVMELIYGRAKAGKPLSGDELMALSDHLKSRGAEIAVLGCTELSLANDEGLIPEDRKEDFQDVLEALALACIRSCREC